MANRKTAYGPRTPNSAAALDITRQVAKQQPAERLGRDYIGVDRKPDYIEISRRRAEADLLRAPKRKRDKAVAPIELPAAESLFGRSA